MNGPRDFDPELSKPDDKDKYGMISHVESNQKQLVQMNLFTKQKKNRRCRKQTYDHQEGTVWGRTNWETRIDIYTPLYIKIINKNLLNSTENSTQYSEMTFFRTNTKKDWIYVFIYFYIDIYMCVCMCVYDSLCCTRETNTTL